MQLEKIMYKPEASETLGDGVKEPKMCLRPQGRCVCYEML
jgi:hypothetical protein